jgi:predicted NAD/FAD-binding protein
MNVLQSLTSRHTWCVTLNGDHLIDPTLIHRRITYRHPVYTLAQEKAHARHDELIATHRTSFCGAYWGSGFHEDGVRSAARVSERLLEVLAHERAAR